jgi:hypothetical protein
VLSKDERSALERLSLPDASREFARDNVYDFNNRRSTPAPQGSNVKVVVTLNPPLATKRQRDPHRFYPVEAPFSGILLEGRPENGKLTLELVKLFRGIEARHRALPWCLPND